MISWKILTYAILVPEKKNPPDLFILWSFKGSFFFLQCSWFSVLLGYRIPFHRVLVCEDLTYPLFQVYVTTDSNM